MHKVDNRTHTEYDIQRVEELLIDKKTHLLIHQLLKEDYAEFPDQRDFLKQPPHFRFLAWKDDVLVGHLAVDHRLISLNEAPLKTFGVVDLCVATAYQGKGIGRALLQKLTELADSNMIDVILLTTSKPEYCKETGFQSINNTFRWLMTNNFVTLGVINRKFNNVFMVKTISDVEWEDGVVDLLGHPF